ncbi:A/B/D/E cyclin [Suhomyces tanzawaensis NRRL Y-17324]|uniref:A/B/D/E cyclin n=1 Tax=Suhomyces tanzawaensis NRRL Y-17324 TaxID=984487 RepID=A0A1E4SCJ7_9ASCO|nr:A/B/D/E cyclin [Suhomyces tanzawaensis NRRL Y-17324]ODV77122.1 A/B/D/E cyclin [Suhomyces tanzawaensis NRRL Y-17324]
MPQTITNENDYRLTRSKGLVPVPSVDDDAASDAASASVPPVPARQYLGDVSNQYGAAGAKQAPKRRPLGGDHAPLQQRTNALPNLQQHPQQPSLASDDKPTSHTSSDSDPPPASKLQPSALAVPSRLPQKRQATESSTNLVEKLHSSSTTTHKKSRLIDYEWQDLDEEDLDDPLMASEYVSDIFHYFYELELRMLPDSQYLYKQKHLKPKMRSILVDWLVEMHLRFRLLPESLFLAINLMDRFMSLEVVQIDKLQLLATGSLFIAAKYEEVFSPSVKNYAYFTDGSYTEEEILQAEKYILTILNFDLNYPNPMNFLRRISKADDYDVQSRTLGKYLLEITAIDYRFIGLKPSLCCASAMYLARLILGKSPVWNGNLIHYSGGYRVNDMKVCAELIFQYLISPVEHDEFFKKYATRKFMKASILCRSWAKKFHSEGKDLFDERLSTHRITLEEPVSKE